MTQIFKENYFPSKNANVSKSSVNNARGFIASPSGQEVIY